MNCYKNLHFQRKNFDENKNPSFIIVLYNKL